MEGGFSGLEFRVEEYRFSIRKWRLGWWSVWSCKPSRDCEFIKKCYFKLSRDAYRYGTGQKYRVVDSDGNVIVEDALRLMVKS